VSPRLYGARLRRKGRGRLPSDRYPPSGQRYRVASAACPDRVVDRQPAHVAEYGRREQPVARVRRQVERLDVVALRQGGTATSAAIRAACATAVSSARPVESE
jgi:hypothetical protein